VNDKHAWEVHSTEKRWSHEKHNIQYAIITPLDSFSYPSFLLNAVLINQYLNLWICLLDQITDDALTRINRCQWRYCFHFSLNLRIGWYDHSVIRISWIRATYKRAPVKLSLCRSCASCNILIKIYKMSYVSSFSVQRFSHRAYPKCSYDETGSIHFKIPFFKFCLRMLMLSRQSYNLNTSWKLSLVDRKMVLNANYCHFLTHEWTDCMTK
jgi:hypothetical protein